MGLLISLGMGVVISVIYALLNVKSPAPPAIALVGLLGMILGSQLAMQFVDRAPPTHVSAQQAAPVALSHIATSQAG